MKGSRLLDTEPIEPNRLEDEMLPIVRTRAAAIRRQAHFRRSGAALAMVVGLLMIVGVVTSAHRRGSVQVTTASRYDVGSGPTTSTENPQSVPLTTSTTTASTATTKTIGHRGSVSTVRPTTTTSTTLPPCSAAEFATHGSSSKDSYPPGETVTVTGTIRNASSRTCEPWHEIGYKIVDGKGQIVYSATDFVDYTDPATVSPGYTASNKLEWNQHCGASPTCPQAPAGTYTASITWGHYGTASVTFRLTPT